VSLPSSYRSRRGPFPSSYRSRRGHIYLIRVLPLVGCRSKTPTRLYAPQCRICNSRFYSLKYLLSDKKKMINCGINGVIHYSSLIPLLLILSTIAQFPAPLPLPATMASARRTGRRRRIRIGRTGGEAGCNGGRHISHLLILHRHRPSRGPGSAVAGAEDARACTRDAGGATISVGADAVGAASSIVALVGALSGGGDPREELQCGSGGSPPRGQRGAASAGSVEDGEAPRPRRGRGDEEEAVTEEARRPWLSSADTTDWGSKSSGQGATRARPNSV
jgi:hypothetical protein